MMYRRSAILSPMLWSVALSPQPARLQRNRFLTITVRIMKHVINPGDKYGRLTVIREVQKAAADGRRYRAALCRCDCGKEITPRISSLNSGDARSCGCSRGQPKYQHKRCPVCGTPAMIRRDRRGCSRTCGY
jgi:hypothetical protein